MGAFDFVGYHKQLQHEVGSQLCNVDDDRLAVVMSDLIVEVEQKLAQNLTALDHEMLACAAGCGSCCMVNVAVLKPEAVNISKHLRCTRNADELAALKLDMRQLVGVISGLDEDERIALRKSCIFLTAAGDCSIYPVRPLMCRSITSINAQDCQDALTMQALGEYLPVTMNLFQKNLFDVAFQALAKALEMSGLDDRSSEMTASVLTYLED